MKIRPLHDRVLLKRLDDKQESSGGIIIPDTAKEKPMQGEVIAVGAGKLLKDGSRRDHLVQTGDRILFGKYAGDEVKIDGVEHLIFKEDEVLAVIND